MLWRLCNIPVTWVDLEYFQFPQLTDYDSPKLLFPISSHPSDLESRRTKTVLRPPGKRLSQIFLTNQMGAKLQGLELGCTSHLILGPVHPLKTSESNRLGREEANVEVHCWAAKHATLKHLPWLWLWLGKRTPSSISPSYCLGVGVESFRSLDFYQKLWSVHDVRKPWSVSSLYLTTPNLGNFLFRSHKWGDT